MNHLEHLISSKKVFFNFMNETFTIFQYSNLFLRDLQYAIISYFEMKENPVKYAQAEILAMAFIKHLISVNELTQVDGKSWRINFEIGLNKKVLEAEGAANE